MDDAAKLRIINAHKLARMALSMNVQPNGDYDLGNALLCMVNGTIAIIGACADEEDTTGFQEGIKKDFAEKVDMIYAWLRESPDEREYLLKDLGMEKVPEDG